MARNPLRRGQSLEYLEGAADGGEEAVGDCQTPSLALKGPALSQYALDQLVQGVAEARERAEQESWAGLAPESSGAPHLHSC